MSQEKEILKALQSGQKLTPKDAERRFDCMRLGARIYDINKHAGYNIVKSDRIKLRSGKTVALYSIEQPEKQTISPLTKTS